MESGSRKEVGKQLNVEQVFHKNQMQTSDNLRMCTIAEPRRAGEPDLQVDDIKSAVVLDIGGGSVKRFPSQGRLH